MNNYRETLEGLVQLYEDLLKQETKPPEPKVPTKPIQTIKSPLRKMRRRE